MRDRTAEATRWGLWRQCTRARGSTCPRWRQRWARVRFRKKDPSLADLPWSCPGTPRSRKQWRAGMFRSPLAGTYHSTRGGAARAPIFQ